MPLTGSLVRCPSVERADELRQRVAPMRPRRVILRQQQAGCVRRELPERDLADVAASLQLDDVFRDGVVEFELAVADRLRQQRGLEHFPQRSEIEQRIGEKNALTQKREKLSDADLTTSALLAS